MKTFLKSALTGPPSWRPHMPAAQITLYEGEGFRGRAFTSAKSVPDFDRNGFNDRTSSVVVDSGRWEICEHAASAACVVLRRGSYDSLGDWAWKTPFLRCAPADNRRYPERSASADGNGQLRISPPRQRARL